jgi:hypothetical protein
LLWSLLALLALWRLQLAVGILLRPTLPAMQGSAVVHWRRLDELLPWVCLALFAIGADVASRALRQAREARLVATAIAVGALLTALSIALDQAGVGGSAAGGFEFFGALALALVALALAAREVRAIYAALRGTTGAAQGPGKGITIIDLWRFAAAQWGLLMAAAIFWIIAAKPREERLGDELTHALFFYLPAAAMLPNVLMAAGISLWNDMLAAAGAAPPRPRVRAWLVALAGMHVGPALLLASLLPGLHVPALMFPGAAFELFAIAFYLAGFPSSAWRGIGGKAHLAAWLCFALALVAAAVQAAFEIGGQGVPIYATAAWRHLWAAGAITFWAIGMGANALTLLGSRTRAARMGSLTAGTIALGLAVTFAVQLLTAARSGEAQVPVMLWLFTGCGLEFLGTLLMAVGI